jgi:hypothetical protein
MINQAIFSINCAKKMKISGAFSPLDFRTFALQIPQKSNEPEELTPYSE